MIFSGTSTPVVDPFTKVPFPNNRIPASRNRSVGRGLVNLYPEPIAPTRQGTSSTLPAQVRLHGAGFPRGSHDLDKEHAVLADNSQSAGRYRTRTGTHQAFKYDAVQSERHVQLDSAIHLFTPSVINEINAGFVRMNRSEILMIVRAQLG